MACCAALAVGGIGFGVYGLFFKKPSANEALGSLSQEDLATISVVSDVKELPTDKNSENQEVVITNPYVLRDLNHQFTVLNGFKYETEFDQVQTAYWAYNDAVKLYNDSNDYSFLGGKAVAEELKPANTWNAFYDGLSNTLRTYLNNLNSEIGVPEADYETVARTGYVPYEQANRAYHDLADTDTDLAKKDYHMATCAVYYYVTEADGFLSYSYGCGGAGYGSFMVRKDSFKAKGDEAYIYTHLISTSGIDDQGGCHVLNGWATNMDGNSVEERTEVDKFAPDSLWCSFPNDYASTHASVIDQGQAYRFIFKKNSEGIYSFSKVEKL